MNGIENRRNSNRKIKNNNLSSDNDDIIKQLSQITSNDDKSFESSLITKNIPILYDINNKSKDVNIKLSERNRNLNSIKDSKKNLDEDNLLINNKYFPLNQKLKYLCSLIQIYNINIKKYDDLQQFNRYFTNDILKPNQLEPINILFDIISELIFYIQREIKNNDILMKEIKITKQKRTEQENIINQLKTKILEKEKAIQEMTPLKKEENFKNDLIEKEINELKKENKELYKKIKIYSYKIKKLESNNNQCFTQTEANNTKNNIFNYTLTNDLNIPKNICNLYTLNNSYDNSRLNLNNKKNQSSEKRNITNIYSSGAYKRNNKYINLNSNFSPLKTLDIEQSFKTRRNNIIESYNNCDNNNGNKNIKDGSIVTSLKLLLKEINDMLNIYNSHLEKINLNNNTNGNDNIKYISDFVNEMNNKMDKLKNYTGLNSDKNDVVYKKSIQVNTSKWKFRKKSLNKNKIKKISDNTNLNLNIKRKNTSSSLRKDLMFNKLLN